MIKQIGQFLVLSLFLLTIACQKKSVDFAPTKTGDTLRLPSSTTSPTPTPTNILDNVTSTVYSSNAFATAANNRGTHLAAWLPSAAGGTTINTVYIKARLLNGVVTAFPKSYKIYLTTSDNSAWMHVGDFNTQPNPTTGVVIVPLPVNYQTHGVLITPIELSVDNNNQHYFQIADLLLGHLTMTSAFAKTSANADDILTGWDVANVADNNSNSVYSSNIFSSSANDRGTFLYSYLPKSTLINTVFLKARMHSNVVHAFPKTYNLYLTNPANNAWIHVGTYQTQPNTTKHNHWVCYY
ncbi:MAG: hypothetical protein SGI74_13860 [Oligoflexia bacterium]|nr:hypothetical protein [Oligoflexia bacterium]